MSLEKAELKRLIVQEVGREINSSLEAAKSDFYRFEGSLGALKQSVEKIEQHKGYWNKDFQDQKITEDEVKLAIKVIDQCRGILTNLYDTAQIQKFMQQGVIKGLERSDDVCSKIFEAEGRKAQAILAQEEEATSVDDGGRPSSRPVGVRPISIAQQRKAEEIKEEEITEVTEVIEIPKDKKRGRKKKDD